MVKLDIDQFKKWLDVSQNYRSENFWNQIFDDKTSNKTGNQSMKNSFTNLIDNFPKCDLYETDNQIVLEAEIPGLKKEDLHITIRHQLLTISGEFKTLKHDRKYFFKERANRSFNKELTLPYPIIGSEVRSELREGVLFLYLPIQREEVENIPITFEHQNP